VQLPVAVAGRRQGILTLSWDATDSNGLLCGHGDDKELRSCCWHAVGQRGRALWS
jgi:hypothetical protein